MAHHRPIMSICGILVTITLVFLSGCVKTEKPIPTVEPETNKFLGVWQSTDKPIPFGSTLRIDSNYVFKYRGGACGWSFLSSGLWMIVNDTLVLNSFYPHECYKLHEFGINYIVVDPETLHYNRKTSIEGCRPNSYDDYTIFDNEMFVIKDSFLIHIPDPNNLWTEFKDDFVKDTSFSN